VMIGTAILLNIIEDHRHGGYYYHYPKGPWHWRSPLVYRRPYRDRFFGHRGSLPRPHPRTTFRPGGPRPDEIAPPHRAPRDHDIRRPGPGLRPGPRPKHPAFRPERGRRPESHGFRPETVRPGGPRYRGSRPEGPKITKQPPKSPSPRREAPPRRRDEELRREAGRGGPRR
jgi:hypothetical protein